MATQGQQEPDQAGLRAEIGRLQEEVLRLQRKLGELHATDLNALRRAYVTLCQHVEALEGEARGMAAALREFETEVVPPELVAKELGVAAAVAFGLSLVHTTVRALPVRAAQSPAVARGLWLLGGVFVLARLTGGALAHVAALMGRNAGRRRRLLRQLEEVQERIGIMAALQQWSEEQAGLGPAAAASEAAGGGAEGEGGGSSAAVPPPRRVSPAASSGSSVELVEMPEYVEELEAAEAGTASGSGGSPLPSAPVLEGAGGEPAGGQAGGGGQRSGARSAGPPDPTLATLAAYAQLGRK